MSSGRSWSYSVVSAEEQRRRALAAASARLERANQSIAELRVAVAGAASLADDLDVAVPESQVARSGDPEAVERQAAALEAEVAKARARVEAAVAETRARAIERMTVDLLDSLRPLDPQPGLLRSTLEQSPAASADRAPGAADRVPGAEEAPADQSAAASQLEEACRVVGRLPGDTPEEVVDRCRALVAEVAGVPTPARGAVLLAALRQEVQSARDRSALVARNRNEVERLYRQLDGLDAHDGSDAPGPHGSGDGPGDPTLGAEVEAVRSLRGHLRGLALDAPLPADLATRVEQVRAAVLAAKDRRFALDVTRQVFEEHGYTLGEDFVTAVAAPGGATLPVAGSPRHGVRVRELAGRITFEVLRFEGTDEGLDDVAAATSFCRTVDDMVERAARSGLDIADRVHVPPDAGRVERLDQKSPFVAGADVAWSGRSRFASGVQPRARERRSPR